MKMAVLEQRNANSEADKEKISKNDWEPLIPGLPDEIAELCLLHLPYPYQALVRSVSSSWNRAITDPSFLLSKKSLSPSLSRPYIFVFAFHRSTAKIQWQALDPQSRRWFVLPPMPLPLSDHDAVCPPAFACASLPRQGKLFVMGGMISDTETRMRTTLVYRTSTNQWSPASLMPTARSFFAAESVNGRIMTVGGSGTRTAEIYDPESDTWTPGAGIGAELARYEAAVVGGRMYVTEGWRWPFMFPPRGAVYEAERDTWREMGEGMKEGWTGLNVVANGRVFVIAEYGDCPMKVYDEDNDTWQYVGGDRFPREVMQRPFAVRGVEGRIYVVSGGLNVAIGSVSVCENERQRVEQGKNGGIVVKVRWEVVEAPQAFRELSPCNCQVLYA